MDCIFHKQRSASRSCPVHELKPDDQRVVQGLVSARPYAAPQHPVAALQGALAGSPTNLDLTAARMMTWPVLKTTGKAMHSEVAEHTRSVV